MPNLPLARGSTANLGVNQVPGNLNIVGFGAHYNIAIAGGAAAPHVIIGAGADVYPINNQSVSVTNTTPAGGADNINLSW
jgi:hypothetical protein